MKELQIKQILHTQRGLSSQSWCDILPLAERIQQRCQKWHITCPNNWLSIQCESLICDLEVLINKIHKDSTIGRIRAWRSKLRESFDVHKHGAAAFAWLNSKAPSNMHAILTAEGQIATDTNEMLNSITHSWQNLFHECELIDINNLKLHLSPLLESFPCPVPCLSGADLQAKIQATKSSRAVALDGWRMTELKFLPTEWFDLVAQCLTLIEDDVSWPDVCVLGMISTIPKGVDNNLDEHDSGSLAVGNGLDTRPITNLSPLYTAYSGPRFSQMSEWREKWLTSCMHGARKSHEIYDVSWSLELHLEYETSVRTLFGRHFHGQEKVF